MWRMLIVAVVAGMAPTPGVAQSNAAPAPSTEIAFRRAIPNIPGKDLVGVVVSYPPGAKSKAHRHAPSAFIEVYVISGAIRSQVDDAPLKVYRAGETWHEDPGAHHVVNENASLTEPAKMLAVLVVDSAEKTLTIPDQD